MPNNPQAHTNPTPLRLYNTLTRRVETFRPQNPAKVKIYTCGPTVYSSPHIGNFAAYVYWDLLLRVLKANQFTPYRVLNLTDVGHLTSDADDGEDKLEKGARSTNQTVWQVADRYIKEFLRDFRALNLITPDVTARATDYISADQALVDRLTSLGYTYETPDGIYFDTSKFPHYADFAHLDLEHLQAGARVEFRDTKRHASDFALWKFIQPHEHHAMRWDYLGRPGYPGWHLECSSIIHSTLGEPIDIHTGGIDHIPIHHTNEIAQSEAAFSVPLARFWLHCNFLTIDGAKISKSLGNTYTLADLSARGFSPLDFKLWVLQGHYQSERDFTFANLAAAKKRRLNWRNQIALAHQQQPSPAKTSIDNLLTDLLSTLNDNLNSPAAFALIDRQPIYSLKFWQTIDRWFGLNLLADSPLPTPDQQKLLAARQAARTAKDFATSDRLRAELAASGLAVLDAPTAQIWQYAH